MPSHHRHNRFFCTLVLALFLGTASTHPLERYLFPVGIKELGARQQTSGTPTSLTASNVLSATSLSQTSLQSGTTRVVPSSTAPSSSLTLAASSVLAVTSSHASTTPSSSTDASGTSTSSSGSATASSSTSTSGASATTIPTSRPSSIFSKDSPYYSYAVGVTCVVAIFGFLILVLFIRFLVQSFSKKPQSQPVTANLGASAWRHSQDSDIDSARTLPTSATATQNSRKGSGAEMGERQAFLSAESVALYPPGNQYDKEPARYTDEEPLYPRRTTRSFSSGSSSAVPFVSRRPGSMSFLQSPPATHPAFIADPASETGHSDQVQPSPRVIREEPAAVPNANATSNLLLDRASHSYAYRQHTLTSGTTDLSRAASTASAYSQQSTVPPVPDLPAQYSQPSPTQLSPDLSAALSSMQRRNGSTDSIHATRSTEPPTAEEGAAASNASARPHPGRLGWAGRAPSSIHGPDLHFSRS